MLDGWIVTLTALGYILPLFAIASYGDRTARLWRGGKGRPLIYALSISVYCTSWTFTGPSVGNAQRVRVPHHLHRSGHPVCLGYKILRRIIQAVKGRKDHVHRRFHRGALWQAPDGGGRCDGDRRDRDHSLYRLAIESDFSVGHDHDRPLRSAGWYVAYHILVTSHCWIAVGLAGFAWLLFGTRHIDATEHQEGLMLAIALEAIVKLVAFLTIGIWVTYQLYDGPLDLVAAIATHPETAKVFAQPINTGNWIAMTTLSLIAVLMLPRQFHVIVTENNSEAELRRATWLCSRCTWC